MPLLHHPVALDELYRMALLREAWTDFGDVGVVRRAGLTKIDNFCQALSHPGVDPANSTNPGMVFLSLAAVGCHAFGSLCMYQPLPAL